MLQAITPWARVATRVLLLLRAGSLEHHDRARARNRCCGVLRELVLRRRLAALAPRTAAAVRAASAVPDPDDTYHTYPHTANARKYASLSDQSSHNSFFFFVSVTGPVEKRDGHRVSRTFY